MNRFCRSLVVLGSFLFVIQSFSQTIGKIPFEEGGYTGKKFNHGEKKIFIQYFNIHFQNVLVEYAKAKGGGSYGSAEAGLALGLDGVTEEQYQKMTDAYYELYLKRLEERGFTIVSAEEIIKNEHFAGSELIKGGTPQQDLLATGYVTTSPTNWIYVDKKASIWNIGGLNESNDLGGIIVARVSIVVPFAESKDIEGGLVGGVAKITAKCDLRLSPLESIPVKSDWKKPKVLTSEISFGYKESLKWQALYQGKLKKALDIGGVLDEDKKYKATSVATSGTGFTARYSEAYAENVDLVPCDADKYQKGVDEAILMYLNASLDGFLSNFK